MSTATVPLVEYDRLRGIEARAREMIRLDNWIRLEQPELHPMLDDYSRATVEYVLDGR